MRELSGAQWRKASRSGGSGGNCVEVAGNLPDMVGVRDSKDTAGPALTFDPIAWSAFVAEVKADRLPR